MQSFQECLSFSFTTDTPRIFFYLIHLFIYFFKFRSSERFSKMDHFHFHFLSTPSFDDYIFITPYIFIPCMP